MRRPFTVALAAVIVTAGMSSATAAPIERYTGSYDPDPESFSECGLNLQEDALYQYDGMIKDSTPKTEGQYFRVLEHYHRTFVVTNTDNHEWVRFVGDGVFREGPGTVIAWDDPPVAGPVVRYLTKDSGALQTVYDSQGKVLMRDRGSITEAYIFDTGGDSQPGGGQVIDVHTVSATGHLPLFEADEETYCGLLTTWIG